MRYGISLLLALVIGGGLGAVEPGRVDGRRYGIAPDLVTYPQGTPQAALASVLKAVAAGRYDYLVAQLADPAFVDGRVQRVHGGRFEQQVEDTRARLDPRSVQLLRRFLKDGTWTAEEDQAQVRLEDVPDRVVFLCRKGGRWFLEHRNRPAGGRPGKRR